MSIKVQRRLPFLTSAGIRGRAARFRFPFPISTLAASACPFHVILVLINPAVSAFWRCTIEPSFESPLQRYLTSSRAQAPCSASVTIVPLFHAAKSPFRGLQSLLTLLSVVGSSCVFSTTKGTPNAF